MKLAKKWNRRIFAAVLGAAVVGAPLFAVHADPAFSQDGPRYDVRRGMYEKEGGSDEHVRLGKYADQEHREARDEERREDFARRQNEERKDFEKRQGEEREDFEKRQAKEREERQERRDDQRGGHREEHRDEHRSEHREQHAHHEQPEHAYNVRRGMYEKEGGSDTEVRRGMYEQPSEDGSRNSLVR